MTLYNKIRYVWHNSILLKFFALYVQYYIMFQLVATTYVIIIIFIITVFLCSIVTLKFFYIFLLFQSDFIIRIFFFYCFSSFVWFAHYCINMYTYVCVYIYCFIFIIVNVQTKTKNMYVLKQIGEYDGYYFSLFFFRFLCALIIFDNSKE